MIIISTYDSIDKIIRGISNYNNDINNENNNIIPDLLVADESHNLVSS
jgi:hypothetical protein